ncbi:MAG: ABC-F family ATP-binding cassette domain-containing protein [Phycisphaerales bacterium]|nr:ABC-F family ATP-binding cassette domain-containing protein [Phycisphaerales bacterium]
MSIARGDRLGLIGPNGAGKSTLLKLLAGEEQPDEGIIETEAGLRAVYVPQQDAYPGELTSREVVVEAAIEGLETADGVGDHHEAELLAEMVMARVGFDDTHAATSAGELSGGWRKRLSIAEALCHGGGEPDLLLLDEPTNHLDLEGIEWLETFLKRSPGGGKATASVFVTHDRAFLESVATRIVELSPTYPQGVLAAGGNYTEFLRRKEEFLVGQARAEQAIANQVRTDLAWLARGPQGRRTKAKGRIEASYDRIDELAELRTRNASAAVGGARVEFGGTGRKTRKLLTAKGVAKSLGGRVLFRGVNLTIGAGDCVGLLGPNGSGKTTLIRVLTGELEPDDGSVSRSEPPPRVVVFSQHRQDFDPTTQLREALGPVGDHVQFQGRSMHITAWSRRFLFRDEQLAQEVGSLSGGELARVHVARLMLAPADVLVLDEPTNDLDIPTLETLEESLEEFPGAIVLVTHDRAMLRRLAMEVISLDGEGGAKSFASVDQALGERGARAAKQVEAKKKSRASAVQGRDGARGARSTSLVRKKLSYSEQREYDGIEARIQEAEARMAAAEARLGDPRVSDDHAKMGLACRELGEAQEAIAKLYSRWEELEGKAG